MLKGKVTILLLACVVTTQALSAQAKPAPEEEPLFGTWVNEEYGIGKGPQKTVILSDRMLDYMLITDKDPHYESRYWIEDQSIDLEGNFWYQLRIKTWYYGYPQTEENIFGDGYALVRVDASGSTIESVWAGSRMPDAEDWGLIPHPAFYRQ